MNRRAPLAERSSRPARVPRRRPRTPISSTPASGPFYDGVSHFALTPEDLRAGARTRPPRRTAWLTRRTLALFALPAAWLLGGLLGLAFPTVESATLATTVSFLALGGLVAAEARLSPRSIAALAIVVGLLHGYLNGGAMAQAKLGGLGVIGIVSTLFVDRAGRRVVVAIRRPGAASLCASPGVGSSRSAFCSSVGRCGRPDR